MIAKILALLGLQRIPEKKVTPFPYPVKIRVANYTNAVAVGSQRSKDINGKLVNFFYVEHDEPFPFVTMSGTFQPLTRRRSFVHEDWVTTDAEREVANAKH